MKLVFLLVVIVNGEQHRDDQLISGPCGAGGPALMRCYEDPAYYFRPPVADGLDGKGNNPGLSKVLGDTLEF